MYVLHAYIHTLISYRPAKSDLHALPAGAICSGAGIGYLLRVQGLWAYTARGKLVEGIAPLL